MQKDTCGAEKNFSIFPIGKDEECWAEITCPLCGKKMQGSCRRRKANQVPRHFDETKECLGVGMEAKEIKFLAKTFIEYAQREEKLSRPACQPSQ